MEMLHHEPVAGVPGKVCAVAVDRPGRCSLQAVSEHALVSTGFRKGTKGRD
jgi:hypothetical protein